MTERSAPVRRWMPRDGKWEPVEVGLLVHDPDIGLWRFSYLDSYLALGDEASELDPHWIASKTRSPFSQVFQVAPGVFADLAVTGWSYEVLKKHYPGSDSWTWWDRIVNAPMDNFGALCVGDPDQKIDLSEQALDELDGLTREDLARFQSDTSSGFMGGERPKICVTGYGHRAIVKFPGKGEADDLAIAEATALTLARELGLNVPDHRVIRYSKQTMPALYIHRFDRPHGTDFLQCVSGATAIGIEPNTVREDRRRSYLALRSKLGHPDDWRELFSRIVLNAAVGNGDDHPWNHSLRQLGRKDWRLSPLYDVMPNPNRNGITTFAMSIGPRGERAATIENLVRLGRLLCRMSADEARGEIARVFDHVAARWRDVFAAHADAVAEKVDLDKWQVSFQGSIEATMATERA